MFKEKKANVYIKVWFEYDFSGDFGANNNEEVFQVSECATPEEIDKMVENMLMNITQLTAFEIEGLFGWSFIDMKYLT